MLVHLANCEIFTSSNVDLQRSTQFKICCCTEKYNPITEVCEFLNALKEERMYFSFIFKNFTGINFHGMDEKPRNFLLLKFTSFKAGYRKINFKKF